MNIQLRPWELTDLENLVRYANNLRIAQNLTDSFPFPYTFRDGENFIARVNANIPVTVFAIIFNEEAIGSIGLFPQQDIFRKNAELGYWLAEPFWGKGIMVEAVKQTVQFGFNNLPLDRIFARPFGTNLASQKVLEKAGFVLEATLKGTILKNGVVLDEMIYAVRRNPG
jgi:[ribosomal protein S5]-alanine N-acetyltransferase